ncbi:MAG: divalent-cation tolerance protein CutA [Bacteroidia bacterium]|nr:divalent-cation tolerance protein CutA [Bacteroidia bacterium]
MEIRWVYITCASMAEAQDIGRSLVSERLAACANCWGGVQSVYWWEGKVVEDQEAVLIAKTTVPLLEALMQRVRALHSYSVPCIEALPAAESHPAYAAWIHETLHAAHE